MILYSTSVQYSTVLHCTALQRTLTKRSWSTSSREVTVKSIAELVVGADTLKSVVSPLLACTSSGLPTFRLEWNGMRGGGGRGMGERVNRKTRTSVMKK